MIAVLVLTITVGCEVEGPDSVAEETRRARESYDAAAVVRDILTTRSAAIRDGDLGAIEQLYVNDDRLLAFRPDSIFRGWETYREYWADALTDIPEGFQVHWHDDLLIHADGDDAIAASLTWSTGGGGTRSQSGRISLVLARNGERFRILHEHLSPVVEETDQ